jgi:NAD(P)-dependent dehydrogenase (short-subunit alcohol dehydrogenase family)
MTLIGRAIATAAVVAAVISSHPASAQSTPGSLPLQGKVVMITGSTDGLGREVARRVGALGAQVIVHGRNAERGKAVVDEITKDGKGSARFYAADFASLAEVRTLAQTIMRDYKRIDVLVNNAGVLLQERQVSKDGHEMNFAVNYLAGFLLTRTLLPTIIGSAPSRIVNVASISAAAIDFTDVMLERPGRAGDGYGQSKLAQVMMTMDLAPELKDRNVIVTAVHPASLMDTTMVRKAGIPARSTVSEGADSVMRQITGTDLQSGQFYIGQQVGRAHPQASDEQVRAQLRQLSLQLTGLK